jgi:tetratricopeptide (TPR) repeat protein
MSRHLFGVLQRGNLELRYRNDTARAVALVDSVLNATPLDSLLRGDRRYDEVARFYIAANQRARVNPLIRAAEANDSALQRYLRAERLWTRGLLALAEGRTPEALDTLRAASEITMCPSCVLPDLGRAYERAGQRRQALDTYHRYVTTPWLWRYEPDAVELGWTLKRLAELSDHVGDTARARSAREQLLALWSDADPFLWAALASDRAKVRQPGPR